jgi:transcriptional regulator with XRE-family HTH domain
MNALGYSATRLADEINVQRSGISHILSGRNQPSYDFMIKLLERFPDINTDWLMLGKGRMFRESDPQMVRSENQVEYHTLFTPPLDTNVTTKMVVKEVTNVTVVIRVILLNSDGSFNVYEQAKKD